MRRYSEIKIMYPVKSGTVVVKMAVSLLFWKYGCCCSGKQALFE